jgi:competence ComEA-like helix-hairpin-helix protein
MIKESEDNQQVRIIALIIVICFSMLLSVFFVKGRFSASQQNSINSLEDRINPNTAPAASLVRLPGIGRAKAEAIEKYKHQVSVADSDSSPFNDAANLDKISGIGPKQVEKMKEFLKFD